MHLDCQGGMGGMCVTMLHMRSLLGWPATALPEQKLPLEEGQYSAHRMGDHI